MADVTFTVDGKEAHRARGDAADRGLPKAAGIEIPAFCYYPGLSLQAACRMCVVRIEKMPKLQTACTTPVAEGMVVATETPEIAAGAQGDAAVAARQPSAGLPGVRCGRRVRTAGHDLQIRRGGQSMFAEPRIIARNSSGRRSSSSIGRAAFFAIAACACAARAWTCLRWAFRTAASLR